MIATSYRPGATWLHRRQAGAKLLGMLIFGGALLALGGAAAAGAGLLAATAAVASVRPAMPDLRRALLAPALICTALGLANAALLPPEQAVAMGLRLLALLFAAHAVATTTAPSAMQAALESGLRPFERLGLLSAARVSLTLTLAIRFIPVIGQQAAAIRDAQAARGARVSAASLAVPLLVRVLRQADALGEALEARGWPPLAAQPQPPALARRGAP